MVQKMPCITVTALSVRTSETNERSELTKRRRCASHMHAEPAAGRLHLARLDRSLTCSLAAQSAASTHPLDDRYGGAISAKKTRGRFRHVSFSGAERRIALRSYKQSEAGTARRQGCRARGAALATRCSR